MSTFPPLYPSLRPNLRPASADEAVAFLFDALGSAIASAGVRQLNGQSRFSDSVLLERLQVSREAIDGVFHFLAPTEDPKLL
jgi:hypothetical protein